MLKKKLLGIMILLVGAMLVFAIISCNDDEPKDEDIVVDSNSIGAVTSLSVKTKGVKSLYLGNLAVTGNSTARAIVNGNGEIPTLTYINEDGKPAPIVFTNSSGKQYMLELVGMDKIDNSRIKVKWSGIYEVTTGDEGYIVGTGEAWNGGALIDMNSGRFFEIGETWSQKYNGVDVACHSIFFIEDNICYFSKDYPNTTVYRVDLNAASPQEVPISNGAFTPIQIARPAFTIDGKIIAVDYYGELGQEWYSMDTTGTRPPTPVTWATLPASAVSSTDGVNYTVTLSNRSFWEGLMMKDLSGNTYMYTLYKYNTWEEEKYAQGLSKWHGHYLIAKLNVDNNGNFAASNVSTGDINFSAAEDQYLFDNPGGKTDYLPFYINDAGVALSSFEDPYSSGVMQTKTFLHNGVYLLNTKGFIKITKKAGGGIEQTSAALNIPRVTRRNAVIKDDYLYWVETGAIKRLKLQSGASVESVYTNSQIVSSTSRDTLFVSGSDSLIFYQYIDASKVHTYSLDLNNPIYGSIKKLAENDIEIKTVVELNF